MPSRTEKLAMQMLVDRGEHIILEPSNGNSIDIITNKGRYEVKSVDSRIKKEKIGFKLGQLGSMLSHGCTVLVYDRVTEKLIYEFDIKRGN